MFWPFMNVVSFVFRFIIIRHKVSCDTSCILCIYNILATSLINFYDKHFTNKNSYHIFVCIYLIVGCVINTFLRHYFYRTYLKCTKIKHHFFPLYLQKFVVQKTCLFPGSSSLSSWEVSETWGAGHMCIVEIIFPSVLCNCMFSNKRFNFEFDFDPI